MARDSFKIQTIEGDKKYFYNGEEVSKKIFEEQRLAAEQKQTEILGASKEDYKKIDADEEIQHQQRKIKWQIRQDGNIVRYEIERVLSAIDSLSANELFYESEKEYSKVNKTEFPENLRTKQLATSLYKDLRTLKDLKKQC